MRRAGAGSTAVAGKAGGREPGGILLTCEHASNAVPAPHRPLFARRQGVLATHRAFDIGARTVAPTTPWPLSEAPPQILASFASPKCSR